jgi:hypothetical protein
MLKADAKQLVVLGSVFVIVATVTGCGSDSNSPRSVDPTLAAQGKDIFRNDTFGDETFWTDTLMMEQVIPTVPPTMALAVGLKVDAEAIPQDVVAGVMSGAIKLDDPATTVALIKLGAVVGIKGTVEMVNGKDTLTRVGVTCALCHSTVDNSFMAGIGARMDGYPNHDLNPGAIIALSPAVPQAKKDVYNSWGPGKYDPRYNLDGIDAPPAVIPPAYGLLGVDKVTATGDGNDLQYWNRYVGVTQMGGHGNFKESRTSVDVTNGTDDQISSKLPALQEYQLSIPAPTPAADTFDPAAADRGKMVFEGAGKCSSCHSGPQFTDANSKLHDPSEVVSEPEPNGGVSYASRSATKMYRTAPLRGVFQHPPYFHNGIAAKLEDVVNLYDTRKSLGLTEDQKKDLVQYLKSL